MVLFLAPPADAVMTDSADHLLDEINKRLTLNLLIQGSAQHAFLTSHYLVRDELAAINPELIRLYDQIALAGFVQYWFCENYVLMGWPDRFWRRTSRPKHQPRRGSVAGRRDHRGERGRWSPPAPLRDGE